MASARASSLTACTALEESARQTGGWGREGVRGTELVCGGKVCAVTLCCGATQQSFGRLAYRKSHADGWSVASDR